MNTIARAMNVLNANISISLLSKKEKTAGPIFSLLKREIPNILLSNISQLLQHTISNGYHASMPLYDVTAEIIFSLGRFIFFLFLSSFSHHLHHQNTPLPPLLSRKKKEYPLLSSSSHHILITASAANIPFLNTERKRRRRGRNPLFSRV